MPTHFKHLADLPALVGQDLGASDWILVDQARIDQFAHATGDHQWIHTDPALAAKGPFGTTVAHGFLTLSLLPIFFETSFVVDDVRMGCMGLRRELRHHAEVGNVPNTAQAIAVAYLCRQGPAMTADDAVRVAAVLRERT